MIGWWLNLAWHLAWLTLFGVVAALGAWRWWSNRRRPSFGQRYYERLRATHLRHLSTLRDAEIAQQRRRDAKRD